MKSLFCGYYDLTDLEFDALWRSCVFVFDTNVLLDMYRFSPETKDALLTVLENNKSRIWIPYQVAMEYHRNLFEVIDGQVNRCDEVIEDMKNAHLRIQQRCEESRNHPYLDQKLLYDLSAFCDRFCAALEDEKKKLETIVYDNPTKRKLAEILEEKIGKQFSPEELKDIYKDGEKRYAGKIPPGYKDAAKKQGDDKYGDLVVWKEILTMAKSKKTPVIFVTSDTKEDWYRKYKGKTLGPRPELISEFFSETGCQFYAYSTAVFLTQVNNYIKSVAISSSVIEEVGKCIETQEDSATESYSASPDYFDSESHDSGCEDVTSV